MDLTLFDILVLIIIVSIVIFAIYYKRKCDIKRFDLDLKNFIADLRLDDSECYILEEEDLDDWDDEEPNDWNDEEQFETMVFDDLENDSN